MRKKISIKLSKEDTKICAKIHKKMMEAIADAVPSVMENNPEVKFQITTVALVFTISNILQTFGIKKPDIYLDDIVEMVKQSYEIVKKNSSYMIYKDGKKVSEGRTN